METFWFAALSGMLTMYVLLDGFDFGVGMLHLVAARTDAERRTMLAAIGPIWNGNEVWLIAGGGLLFFAFPQAYASGFSGFYLALILVLWLLMFRGLAIELRSHFEHPVWRTFWDACFSVSSLLLAVVFGAALGNLIRGVPLNSEGYFFVALWTDFLPGRNPGILDWFTVLLGLTTMVLLTVHGAAYLTMKTSGELVERVWFVARRAGWLAAGLLVLVVAALPFVQPGLRGNYDDHPMGYVFPLAGLAGLVFLLLCLGKRRPGPAFMSSCVMIAGFLASVAWGMFPHLLIATTNPAHSLTAFNAAASPYGLRVGVGWFAFGIALALTYTFIAHRTFWGKVPTGLSPADRQEPH